MIIIHLFSKNIQIMFLTILARNVIKATFKKNTDFRQSRLYIYAIYAYTNNVLYNLTQMLAIYAKLVWCMQILN